MKRLKAIVQTEGILYLVQGTLRLIANYCFQCSTFYVYQYTMTERNEADFLPKIKDLTFHMVTTNEQADELALRGFDFRFYSLYAARRLNKGAIAFCFFVGHELAHIGWVALNKEAKDTFDPHPYHVDFKNKEACTGGSFTIPKYGRQGLMTYGYYKRLEFLKEHGVKNSRNIVNIRNIASQKAQTKLNPEIRAKAFYLKILWWQYWKQIPI